MNIANISIKRPVFISVVMITLTILGYVCYQKLVLNDMPNVDLPYVTVAVTESGATPEEIETKITKQVEDAVQQISGVQNITSTVNSGSSQTMVEFDLSKDSEIAAQEVRDKVSSVRGQFPTDANDPVISKLDMSASSIISIAVYGSDDNQEMADFVDNTLKKKLYTVSGVGAINVSGEDTREIHIKLDNNKLLQYGLTSSQVLSSIKNDNIDQSSGKVTDGDSEVSITTNSKIQKVEDFKNILVSNKNGTEIRVKDVATVEDGIEEKTSQAYYQGNPSIGIDILKQSGSNTVEVAKDVKTALNEVQASLPKNMHADIVSDNSTSIQDTVDDVMQTIKEGCILAVIIVFLFLNEWESTLISASSLPISIITTFICMKEMNFSLNTMSLMALSLAVGLLIDDAIVVIENIVRHLHMGKNPIDAAREATSEIGFAVIATTSAVIAVFLPIAMIDGILGKYFIEFALTIVFSMAVSLFVSFTLVPMMSSKMLRAGKKESKTFIGKFFRGFNNKFDAFSKKYSKLLAFLLRKRLIVLALCGVMLVGSISLVSSLGFTMMPTTDKGQINVSANFDSGITLDTASQKTKQLEAIISKYPEVKYMYSTATKRSASISITLVDKKQRKDSAKDIALKLSNDLKVLPGMEVSASAASMGGGGGSSKYVTYNIVGEDREKVQAFAEKIKAEISKDPQATDVGTNTKLGTPEVKMTVDRNKAADLGVNSSEVASTLTTLFNGSTVTKYDGGKDRYDVKVMLQDDQRKNLNNLDGIYVSGSKGSTSKLIPINQVTKKVIGTTSSTLHRYNKQAQVELSCNVKGLATGTFKDKYLAKIQSELPSGVSLSVGGSMGSLQKSMVSLVQNAILSILLLYLVMAAQFESFVDPISIMFALPLAIIGAIIALFVCGNQLSLVAVIGIVMLMGLAAKNGILLVDAAKERIEQGMPRNEALVEAGLVRIRPIIMTTLAMIFGMIPTAIAKGSGTEMRAPMAQAIIGGLITSTILTLFVIPIVYSLLDDLKRAFKKLRHRKSTKIKVDEGTNLGL
ncbi:efflux RND transporter permease subunit [Clostridium saccharobutylicum]|uniref:efflux RND transporter permease subunit n=1 Tax=Clostridium saccharobutylicum TaxID=169679 RepID=UPI0015F93EF8|nr:efflux RND transporter permease subunit [Clostridium saccharobutylicum]MBA8894981.1 HAE1 family hydrophobic/amphiphilic exporter-1 [Clostridium saccharobutylicum]MBC2400303.1 efflux RND transporter permease subunit [Clostridium saccharobutylicum]